jgi:RNA-directed DNA polymerase
MQTIAPNSAASTTDASIPSHRRPGVSGTSDGHGGVYLPLGHSASLDIAGVTAKQLSASNIGYRPGKSALDAVGMARQRCWRRDWVLDLDIKAFFDSIETELLMRAVRKHTDCPWALLYIDRWLKAPMQMADGSLIGRERGTPQGGVISPLLANLFLHYAFDLWMRRHFPDLLFERYADDGAPRRREEEALM